MHETGALSPDALVHAAAIVIAAVLTSLAVVVAAFKSEYASLFRRSEIPVSGLWVGTAEDVPLRDTDVALNYNVEADLTQRGSRLTGTVTIVSNEADFEPVALEQRGTVKANVWGELLPNQFVQLRYESNDKSTEYGSIFLKLSTSANRLEGFYVGNPVRFDTSVSEGQLALLRVRLKNK